LINWRVNDLPPRPCLSSAEKYSSCWLSSLLLSFPMLALPTHHLSLPPPPPWTFLLFLALPLPRDDAMTYPTVPDFLRHGILIGRTIFLRNRRTFTSRTIFPSLKQYSKQNSYYTEEDIISKCLSSCEEEDLAAAGYFTFHNLLHLPYSFVVLSR